MQPHEKVAGITEELLVTIGQKNAHRGLRRHILEFIGALRQWLRDKGFAELANWSDADIAHLLKRAKDTGKTGKRTAFMTKGQDDVAKMLRGVSQGKGKPAAFVADLGLDRRQDGADESGTGGDESRESRGERTATGHTRQSLREALTQALESEQKGLSVLLDAPWVRIVTDAQMPKRVKEGDGVFSKGFDALQSMMGAKPLDTRLGGLVGKHGDDLRKEAQKEYPKGETETNKTSHETVKFVMAGFREMKSHSADERVLQIIPSLHELFRDAAPLWVNEDDGSHPEVKRWHHYGVRAMLNGEDVVVRLVARELKDGSLILLHHDADVRATSGVEKAMAERLSAPMQSHRPAKAVGTNASKDRLVQWIGSVQRSDEGGIKFSKSGVIRAYYDPTTKTVNFVAYNIPKGWGNKELFGLVSHEIAVHALRLGRADAEFQSILAQLRQMKDKGVADVLRAYNRVPSDTKASLRDEEALGYLNEANPHLPIVRRFVAWLRKQIRALGKTLPANIRRLQFFRWADKLTTDDLRLMARDALVQAAADMRKNVSPDFAMTPALAHLFSRSPSTQAAYEARIDELFNKSPANRSGVKILDRSDVLGVMGLGEHPLHLAEGKVILGQTHHKLTKDDWKKVPEWIENPVAVFDSEQVAGRLLFVAPETKQGKPIVVIIEPDTEMAGMRVHLAVNAYDDQNGTKPYLRWANDGLLRYVNTKESPAFKSASGLQLPRVSSIQQGYKQKIYTERDLVKYRKQKYSVSGEDARAAALVSQYANVEGAPTEEEIREAVRQYRAVEDRYKVLLDAHKADPEKNHLPAPNGKPSKLNREQWILTRTPNFKRWIGDWESVAQRNALDAMTPIRSDFAPAFGEDFESARNASRDAYRAMQKESEQKRFGAITADRRKVKFSGRGFKEVAHHAADRRVLAVAANLKQLIESAIPIYSDTPSTPKQQVRAFHHYAVKADFGGHGEAMVWLEIVERDNGEFFYDADATSIENARAATPDPLAVRPKAGAGIERGPQKRKVSPMDALRQPRFCLQSRG